MNLAELLALRKNLVVSYTTDDQVEFILRLSNINPTQLDEIFNMAEYYLSDKDGDY